jgi:hypothetical protein
MLGQTKNLGQGIKHGADTIFGVPNKPNDWNAAKCIHGEPTEREIMPD